ncbi:peptide chain release factor 1 [Chrysiogenes arsenatis]|uniref:peptide chain release factor 1 n=1 Tax=Chrysiogenes arsenatis TaxID=309797 RepID=UPI00040D4CD1|nr:peptide chain release factor 1 [Chrysiogenes arsenatis]
MLDKLQTLEERYQLLSGQLTLPETAADNRRFRDISKEVSDLSEIVQVFNAYKKVLSDLEDNRELVATEKDRDMRELAIAEIEMLEEREVSLKNELTELLTPKDPNDDKNVILEIRAGTGGDEAGLFVADLFRMYSYYAESRRWKVETLSVNETGVGGYKEVIAMINGKGAYSRLKYESGTHRVQRVPATESSGRIHTSAVTVAVLPEAEEVDIDINPTDLRIDVYRSSGAGGQHVNTTDSAIRITHIPTGIVVTCQDERSQHKNKDKGMRILRAKILDHAVQEADDERSADRKKQVGSGDRSERIRTYNYPQGRVTDHRVGLTLHRLDAILEGDLDEIIETLIRTVRAGELSQGE